MAYGEVLENEISRIIARGGSQVEFPRGIKNLDKISYI